MTEDENGEGSTDVSRLMCIVDDLRRDYREALNQATLARTAIRALERLYAHEAGRLAEMPPSSGTPVEERQQAEYLYAAEVSNALGHVLNLLKRHALADGESVAPKTRGGEG